MVSKSFFSLVAVAAAAMVAASPFARAQTTPPEASAAGTAPVTRDQRKAETAAANKSGQLTPAGQGGPAMAAPTGAPVTSSERKAQAQADAKAGNMAGAGDAGAHKPAPKTKSTKTRSERKAETAAANKSGKIKSGEGSFR